MRPFTFTDAIASCLLAIVGIALTQSLLGCGGGGPEVVSDADLAKVRKEKKDKEFLARRVPMNATQLRGIHQGMVIFASGNRDYYPGLDSQGKPRPGLQKTANQFGAGGNDGTFPAHRYAILVSNAFCLPEYMISPFDKGAKTILAGAAGRADVDVTPDNFSYAMLGLANSPGRATEWRGTQNSQAAVVTDRNTGGGAGNSARSIHNSSEGWAGHVAWNDNHVTLASSSTLKNSRFGVTDFTGDDLFGDENGGKDAAMVFHDAAALTDQK